MVETSNPIVDIRIALYWRELLGDIDYVNYDPKDLRRWYDALETRGPDEISAYIEERHSRYRMTHLLGLVDTSPHPPISVVELWLKSHEQKIDWRPVWAGLSLLLVFSFLAMTNLNGCQYLTPENSLIAKPGMTAPSLQKPPVLPPPEPSATHPTVLPPLPPTQSIPGSLPTTTAH